MTPLAAGSLFLCADFALAIAVGRWLGHLSEAHPEHPQQCVDADAMAGQGLDPADVAQSLGQGVDYSRIGHGRG